MTDIASGTRIRCCIEAPHDYVEKAQYAIRMLLFPYRVDVEFESARHLSTGDIYYGTHPEHAPPGVYVVGLDSRTVQFFSGVESRPAHFETVVVGGEDVPALFPCIAGGAFDLIASSFFFLSGWQETKTTARDEHGRVRYEDSLQASLGSPDVPYVDVYRVLLYHLLGKSGKVLTKKKWRDREWVFCPTHDIDYIRKWRPGIIRREIIHRAVRNRESESVANRFRRVGKTMYGLLSGSNPFQDAITRMRREVSERDGTATYFFKAAARAPHDVRYSPTTRFLKEEFAQLQKAGFEIALHPSYHAFDHTGYLREEKNILAGASGVITTSVRTHYLRFDPSNTPAVLEQVDFNLDSTLGWASQEGFRYATCSPFQLFDLKENRSIAVWEMPLILMESTLFNRQNLTLRQSTERTRKLMKTCRRYGGVFVGLWHNTLWDEDEYPGWGEHFISALDLAQDEGALISSLREALQSWS